MMKQIAFFSLLMVGLDVQAQEFSFPESLAMDASSASCYVSNFNGNCIIKLEASGQKSFFVEDIANPLGEVLEAGVLYFVNGNRLVKGIRIKDGQEVFSVSIEEAGFLNDLTTDKAGMLYASDSATGKIFRISISDQDYSILSETGFDSLNGILCDCESHRLVFCDFSAKGQVGQYDLETGEMLIVPVDLGVNLDGITADEDCFYFSSWGPGSFQEGFQAEGGVIYCINKDFSGEASIVARGEMVSDLGQVNPVV